MHRLVVQVVVVSTLASCTTWRAGSDADLRRSAEMLLITSERAVHVEVTTFDDDHIWGNVIRAWDLMGRPPDMTIMADRKPHELASHYDWLALESLESTKIAVSRHELEDTMVPESRTGTIAAAIVIPLAIVGVIAGIGYLVALSAL